jgi:SulP family sulfate permease
MVYGQKVTRFVPGTILALLASTALSLWFDHTGHFVNTIASQFSYTAKDGAFIPGIPPYPPTLHLAPWPGFAEWTTYIVPALFIAFLAALESLLSATIADSMTGDKHDSNAELWGIGFGNIASGLCAGIPATGAIARTSALINNHGQTPIASTMHAIFIFIYMMLLAHWIGYVPMPALAAILICAAYRMSHWRQCVALLRARNRQNSLVLLVTFALTISIDMVVGVGSGLVLAVVLKRLSRASSTANK